MPDQPATALEEPKTNTLSPLRRNWVWFGFQSLAQVVFTIYFRVRTRGLENLPSQGGGLLLMNHQSFLDPLVTGVWINRPVSYLARANLFRVPIIGWILRHTYVLPINRAGGSTAVIRETVRRLEQGFLVGIFPEGTRSVDGEIGRLKPGFLAVIRRSKVPVIPVGIAGTEKAFGRGSWFPKPFRVRIVIGAPLPSAEIEKLSGKGHESEMLELVKQQILTCRQAAEEWPSQKTDTVQKG